MLAIGTRLSVLAVAVTAVGASVLAAVALAAGSFSDPADDNNSAPDVTSVTVSESSAALLSVSVVVANHRSLPPNSWLNLWFDLDSNLSTGDDGDEALVRYLDDGGLQFYLWDGSRLARQPTTGMSATFVDGVFTLTAPRSAVNDATAFGILAVGARSQDVGGDEELIASDFAPDSGRGAYVAPGPMSVADQIGDHDAAPDITGVQVVDTKAGTIAFTIATPSHATLPPDTWIELDVDVDRRRSTGDGGVEVYVGLFRGQVYVGRWDASEGEFVRVRNPGVRARNADGVVTLQVPRGLFEGVASFGFYFVTGDSNVAEEEDHAIDLAPDGDAWWRYTLANKAALRLIAGVPRVVPSRPRPGASFTVVVPIRRSDTARGIGSGVVTCVEAIQGRSIRAAGRIAAGAARCSLALPGGARGTVRGVVRVRSAGAALAVPFSFRVR